MQLMTPKHPKWKDFFTRLAGPEGCHFRQENGEAKWDCQHGEDKRKAQALLYQFVDVDVNGSLEWFQANGAPCDCQILFVFNPKRQEIEHEAYITKRRKGGQPKKIKGKRQHRTKQGRLLDARKLMGYTQQEMAVALGMTAPDAFKKISRWENAYEKIPDEILQQTHALLMRYRHVHRIKAMHGDTRITREIKRRRGRPKMEVTAETEGQQE